MVDRIYLHVCPIDIPHIFSIQNFQKMKHLFLLGLMAIFMTSCGMNRPEPNYEGVLMSNYGKNGLADFQVVTGAQGWLWWGSELYQVPMFEQKANPAEIVVTSKDGGFFKVNPQYTYEAIRGKGPEICFNYKHVGPGPGFMDNVESNVLDPLVLNAYREEARNFKTDSLLNNVEAYENAVENRLKKEFKGKFFNLLSLTSGLRPPDSMIKAIEERNNAVQQAGQVKNELEVSQMRLQKARIDAETDRVKSAGLTKEVLQENWIEAIRNTNNKVIITDGKTPIILGGNK